MPLRESGRGRSVCTTQVSISVVGPSLMSTGSCRLPTALTGEWAVMDTLPMEVWGCRANHMDYIGLGLLEVGERMGPSTQLHSLQLLTQG